MNRAARIAIVVGCLVAGMVAGLYAFTGGTPFFNPRAGFRTIQAGDFHPLEIRRASSDFKHPIGYGDPTIFFPPPEGGQVLYVSCDGPLPPKDTGRPNDGNVLAVNIVAPNGDSVRLSSAEELPSGHLAITIPPIQPPECEYLDVRLTAKGKRTSVIRLTELPQTRSATYGSQAPHEQQGVRLEAVAYCVPNKGSLESPLIGLEIRHSGLDSDLSWFWSEISIPRPFWKSLQERGSGQATFEASKQPMAAVFRQPFSSYQQRVEIRGVLRGYREKGPFKAPLTNRDATPVKEIPFHFSAAVRDGAEYEPMGFGTYWLGEFMYPRELNKRKN